MILKYYQNEPKLDGVYSRDKLLKTKDGAYVINLDGKLVEALYGNNVTYFDSLGVENIPKEIKKSYPTKISQEIFMEYKQMSQ